MSATSLQDQRRQFLRGFPLSASSSATPRRARSRVGDVALYNGAVRAALRGAVVGRLRGKRSAIRARRSTTCWCSTSCSARPCRTSRSMPSPISAMPTATSSPVYPGDTLSATSEVIGLKENSNRKTGIVYVRSRGFNQDGTTVLEYVRWVMVRKRDERRAGAREITCRGCRRRRAGDARRRLPDRSTRRPMTCARRQPVPLRRLRGRREDRPRRRRHRRGRRAHDRDAALPEHRAHPFRSLSPSAKAASASG